MKTSLLQQAAQFYQNRRRKQLWYRVVSGMACVVVFCTVYALILPAITLEKEPLCGLEEHTHTEDCYTTQTVWPSTAYLCDEESLLGHTHDETCYDEDDHLICGYADFVVHTHDDSCNDRNGDLVCPLPEIKEHEHDRYCYRSTAVLTCEQEETGHIHDKTCYTSVRGELNCGMEEFEGHIHSADCYTTVTELICGEEEITLHTHDEGCFDEDENLICGKVQVLAHRHDETCVVEMEGEPEEVRVLICGKEEHTHTDLCYEPQMPATEDGVYICGLEAHTHDETCYSESGELICGLEEHVHDESCVAPPEVPSYICGKEEHTHDETCYDESGELICGLEEHVHGETCLALPEVPLRELTYKGADYTVTVSFGEDAALPEGVTLSAEEIAPDTEEYQKYYQQTLDTLTAQQTEGAEQVLFARFFDVQFLLDGQVLEPAAPVSVTITYDEPVETGEDVSCQAIHFTEDGPELLEAEAEEDPESGATSFTHTQESFSVVGSLVTRPLANPTDIGLDSLPVDYFVCIDGRWTCVGTTKTGWYAPADASGWNDYNRDYITVEQAASILGKYGFTGEEANSSLITAYQQKTGNLSIYSDTNTVTIDGRRVLPLSRNDSHAGYNLYYLPANQAQIHGVISPENLDKAANGFYTVTVYDSKGTILNSEIVKTGGSFTYTASETPANGWLVAYGNGSTGAISGNTISISNITTSVTVSPKQGEAGSHSVTFKVMVDGQWQEVGSLPYYYTGMVNGSQRAYITSDMAAQFFGDFGYTATTEPGYRFGYSYNDIYTIFYVSEGAVTNYCMDVKGGTEKKIYNGQEVQLYQSNGTSAQMFRIWDYGAGYSYITPVDNSAYHVNVLGGGTADGTKLGIHTATDEASHWKVVQNSDGTVSFYNKNAPNSAVIDLNGGNVKAGVQLQIWNKGSYRCWKLVQHYRVSNKTVSSQNEDGTYNIGLTAESNGDIVCYYMPAKKDNAYINAAESAINAANSIWSVSVRDDTNTVYSDGELSAMVQYVAPNGEATVTVANAEGILWSCRGVNGAPVEVEETQFGGFTTFVIKNITQPIEVTATRANPGFTVQYYAWMDVAADSGSKSLDIIDTTGGKLPGNYTSWVKKAEQTAPSPAALKQIYLNDSGTLSTTPELLEVYSSQAYQYELAPGLAYVNKLAENSHYTLKEIWVLKSNRDPASTQSYDWTVYGPDATFVNSVPANANEIMVTDTMVIRLVYEESKESYTNGVNFYDYDITNGSYETKYDPTHRITYQVAQTSQYGINSSGNYSSSGTKLAFGNRNTGMSLQDLLWGTNYLNHYNASLPANDPGYGLNMDETRSYKGCTFGLVTSLKNGVIQYASGVDAPKLFNESGTVTGKTAFDNGEFNLKFDRVGDTYTLSAVNTAGGGTAAGNLDQFNHALGSNNFWPMDSASTWGASGHDLKFGSSGLQYARRYNTGGYYSSLPVSDDGQDHNSYFGMQYAVNFNLTSDYVGPLEYYFYGDDDMWVFLDDKLVCDIGGVHSTVGEYVNLWDYIEKGSAGIHTLSFFYTERGASGSTCYMRFTLPSVSNATTVRDIGQLQIGKTLGGDATGLGDVAYDFRVDLLTGEKGSPLSQTFNYTVSDTDKNTADTYGTVKSGGTIKLKNGETALIKGLPAGTYYTVTELSTEGYKTTVNGQEGYITKGTVSNGGTAPANFVNTPFYELPQTGGTGAHWYTLGGLCLMAGALLLLYRTKTRGKGGKANPC